MEGAAQAVVSLGTEVVVRKDWKVVAQEMAQTRWAPEEVVAPPPETLREAKVAKVQSWKRGSRSCLTVEAAPWKVRVRFPTRCKTPTRKRARRPWEESQWLILSHTSQVV